MALLSDYKAGTLTIAANDTAVTGSGTAWLAAGFGEGDVLIANGYFAVVGSVQSNTALTLAQPWRGGALSGAGYRLRYQGDGSRISAQARALVELLGGSGNLEALGKLGATANQLPYFTGAGQMAATPLTAFARSLLGGVDQAAVRTTLGLNSNATFGGVTRVDELSIGPGTYGARNGLRPGNGDNATYETHNFKLSGWWGMGMETYDGSINGYYDFRQGKWDTKGGFFKNGVEVLYSNGGTVTGNLTVNGGLSTRGALEVGAGSNASYVAMIDTDEGTRYLHNNGGTIGFLNAGGGWVLRTSDDGTLRLTNNSIPLECYLYTDGNIRGAKWFTWGSEYAFDAISAKINSLISGSLATSGYTKLQNGLIIQWGRANTTANANVTLPFPIVFPNAVYSVVASNLVTVPDNNTFYAVSIDDPQLGSFNARGRYFSNGGGIGAAQLDFSFIAIGR
jgi:hypothetical protein